MSVRERECCSVIECVWEREQEGMRRCVKETVSVCVRDSVCIRVFGGRMRVEGVFICCCVILCEAEVCGDMMCAMLMIDLTP